MLLVADMKDVRRLFGWHYTDILLISGAARDDIWYRSALHFLPMIRWFSILRRETVACARLGHRYQITTYAEVISASPLRTLRSVVVVYLPHKLCFAKSTKWYATAPREDLQVAYIH